MQTDLCQPRNVALESSTQLVPLPREAPTGSPYSLCLPLRDNPCFLALAAMMALIAWSGATVAVASDADLDPGEQAWVLLQRGQTGAAVESAQAVLRNDPTQSRAASVLLNAWLKAGQADSARSWVNALTVRSRDVGLTALGQAILATEFQEPAAVDSLLNLALAGFESLGDELGVLVASELQLLGMIRTGRHQEAVPLLDELLISADYLQQQLAVAFAHLNLGRALVRSRRMEEAGEHLQQALELAERWDAPAWQGDAAIALSVISRLRMDLDEALQYRQQALAAYEAACDLAGQARSRHYIATIYIFRGELTEAMTMLQAALELARQAEDENVEAGCLGDLASLNYLLGDFERATTQYQEALRLVEHPLRRAGMQINLGSLLAYQGRHEEALVQYEEALVVVRSLDDPHTETQVLQGIGQSQCELGDYDTGLATLQQAVDLAQAAALPMEEAYAQHYLGHGLLDAGQLEQAAVALDAASRLAEATGYFDIMESAHLGQAMVARAQGDLETALVHLQEAVDVIMTVRRRSGGSNSVQTGYFSQAGKSFGELVDLLYEMHSLEPQRGLDEQAFQVAQTAKARSLLDLLAEAEVDLRCRADPVYQEREAELLGSIAELEQLLAGVAEDSAAILTAEMSRLENQLDLLEVDLRTADPRYAELRYPRPCSLSQAREEVLGEGELLLDFYLTEKASYLWAVSRRGIQFYQLPARAEIEEAVKGFLPLLQDYNLLGDDAAYYVRPAWQLYQTLLGPATTDLADARQLVIAPDGILHYLPFEALVTARSSERDFANLHYLVRQWDMSYVPSLSALARLRESGIPDHGPTNLLLIGDPVMGEASTAFASLAGAESLTPVPEVDGEISGIMSRDAGDQPVILRGGDATHGALQQATGMHTFRYVHFATHGLYNEHRPQYSGLVLTPDLDQGDDGFLTAAEIFALDLECEQVALSACSSALGERIDGEGVIGLTRAFMYAGARSVVAALWDVSGGTTAVFMTEFYGELAAGSGVDRVRALSETKRRLIRGEIPVSEEGVAVAHPTFWAAFVLSGEG